MQRLLLGIALLSGFSVFSEKPDFIRAPSGREIGRTERRDGKLVARDRHGRELGTYDPKRNETRDKHGRLLYYGNTLAVLIVESRCGE